MPMNSTKKVKFCPSFDLIFIVYWSRSLQGHTKAPTLIQISVSLQPKQDYFHNLFGLIPSLDQGQVGLNGFDKCSIYSWVRRENQDPPLIDG
jgi:hypothetical protein